MDEVFKSENFIAQLSPLKRQHKPLPSDDNCLNFCDYLIVVCKQCFENAKKRQIFLEKDDKGN